MTNSHCNVHKDVTENRTIPVLDPSQFNLPIFVLEKSIHHCPIIHTGCVSAAEKQRQPGLSSLPTDKVPSSLEPLAFPWILEWLQTVLTLWSPLTGPYSRTCSARLGRGTGCIASWPRAVAASSAPTLDGHSWVRFPNFMTSACVAKATERSCSYNIWHALLLGLSVHIL